MYLHICILYIYIYIHTMPSAKAIHGKKMHLVKWNGTSATHGACVSKLPCDEHTRWQRIILVVLAGERGF